MGQGWVKPAEFWTLRPAEVWWLIDAHMPPEREAPAQKFGRLYEILEQAEAQGDHVEP